jgi:RNA polymerase sigma factor (sigma-70 family)
MQNISDAELMRLVLDKHREALDELYDRYIRLVYSFALKSTKDEGRARMIVQLVFTRLWTTEKGYDESKGNFVNWLLTITRNCIIDEVRKEKKYQDQIQLSPERWEQLSDEAEKNNPEALVLHKEKKERIQRAFKWLSENQVQLLQLLYWEGYSLREIAELKNEPLGTIKSRLHQTLKILRKHMVLDGEG